MVKHTEFKASIGGGKFINFKDEHDWIVFAALTSPYPVFAQIYEQTTGAQPTLEFYESFQTSECKAQFNRIIWNTKLSTGLPLWKALLLKRGKV